MLPQSKRLTWPLLLLIAVSLACLMPGVSQPSTPTIPETSDLGVIAEETVPEPTQPPPPTATPPPLPPALVEVKPLPGTTIPLQGTFTFYFNQPMDKPSVELALSGQPALSGRFNWLDDTTVVFESDVTLLPGSELDIQINSSALAKNGKFLQEPITLQYQVAPPLKVTQLLPEPGVEEVNPTSAIVASFNQPVVSTDADPTTFPDALMIDPAVPGVGEWVNESTYVYTPEPAMVGGTIYTVRLNTGLMSVFGGPFEGRSVFEVNAFEWSFETALPRLVSISPGDGATGVGLDTVFQVNFSQPMDTESVEESFSLSNPEHNRVSGDFDWDEDQTTLIFTPTILLARDTNYTVALLGSSRASGGPSLGFDTTARVKTVPVFKVLTTQPENNGTKGVQSNVSIGFSSPAQELGDPLQFIYFSPNVDNLRHWWGDFNRTLNIQGDFQPLLTYTVTVSGEFPDPWGVTIRKPYTFTFETAALDPAINIAHGSPALTLKPEDSTVTAQVTHIDQIEMRLGSVSFTELVEILAPGSYERYQNFQPMKEQNWTYKAGIPGDKNHLIQLPITPKGQGLEPGIYYLGMKARELISQPSPFLLISSNVQLSFKLSTTSALVWAVDLRTMEPVAGQPVTIYDNTGTFLTSGSTDAQGIFQSPISTQADLYTTYYAMMSEPGEEFFSLSLSNWNQGIGGSDFGLSTDFSAPGTSAYLYTDSPVYHPGQDVHYRGVVRYEFNGRYAFPGIDTIPMTIYDGNNNPIQQMELEISEFGTVQGKYSLPDDAMTGSYQISILNDGITFQVVPYRKPKMNLTLDAPESLVAGDVVEVQMDVRYFWDVPATNIPVSWQIYRMPISFSLPGFQVGPEPYRWLKPPWQNNNNALGELVSSGEGRTDPAGQLMVSLPTLDQENKPYRYTFEATLADESRIPVSSRTDFLVHPGDFYIGLRPETWVGQSGTEITFDVFTMDWTKTPVGAQELTARFREISWTPSESPDPFDDPTYTPQYTPVSSADLVTGSDGVARLAFTPPRAGTYELEVSGSGIQTSILIWVGGEDPVQWVNLPDNHLKLTADKESYLPGDRATIFIPNPFLGEAQALVTVERDEVLRYDVLSLDGSGIIYPVSLTDQDTPNIYLSVILIGRDASGRSDFRQGYLNLEIKPLEKELNIVLSINGTGTEAEPQLKPGESVNLIVRISDSAGRPVRGEFSLAVVDSTAGLLADPNAADILTAFYGVQPLGVRTSLSLAVDAQRQIIIPDDDSNAIEQSQDSTLWQDFPDTAFWQADITTDANGEANLTLTLPDILTTWQVEVQAVSTDTLVGKAWQEWLTKDDLLVEPVVPLFLVAGDHTHLAAKVHNLTIRDLSVDVSLQTTGFSLDQPNDETQRLSLEAGSSAWVTWVGQVEETESLDLVFSASSSGYQDSAAPLARNIPVTQFIAPQTFGSAGILDLEGEQMEVVSLPRTFDPVAGTLDITLAPSLAAAMTDGFDLLENSPHTNTEQILSSFLPNLMAYRTIQGLGLDAPVLAARLERTLEAGIQKLSDQQNEDGGWSWWIRNEFPFAGVQSSPTSDSYLSAYILFGLGKARQVGVFVEDTVIQNGRNYLLATLPALEMLSSTWQLDRLAFHYLALSMTGEDITDTAKNFLDVRDQLSPYAEAFLALTLANEDPGDSRIDIILSDLKATAIQNEMGVHWQGKNYPANLDTPIFNTAAAVYTLAQYDPASPLISDALRYMMSHRKADGSWGSSYETAWTLLALTEIMKGTGELAGNYAFSASLNGEPILEGEAGGDTRLNTVSTTIPISDLYPSAANGLSIQRSAGPGRLYYSAYLQVSQPAAEVAPLYRGIHVTRSYEMGEGQDKITVGDRITVRVAVTLEKDANYLVVKDFIPAGAEILDANLYTMQTELAGCSTGQSSCYLPKAPFENGWGWWWFEAPLIDDDHITWASDYLPAGNYELAYTMVLTHPGEYQVLPARAWQMYLPEVFGYGAGEILKIDNLSTEIRD